MKIEDIDMIQVSRSEYEQMARDARPVARRRRAGVWRRRTLWTFGGFVVLIVGMAILGANLPDPAANASVRPSVTTHPKCPTGTPGAWVWTSATYAEGTECQATIVVHGVTISYVIEPDGSTLATVTVGTTCHDAGDDMTRRSFFTDTDC